MNQPRSAMGDSPGHAGPPSGTEDSPQPMAAPAEVPGYRPVRLLGRGAFGEVWVALDVNTGRQVAIKFLTHRAGLDASLFSREVEKLVLLSTDRYIVQLLQVGWDANPAYFVMEYLEGGSLEDLLQRKGTLPPERGLELFREIVIGISHAHRKGILHCDLKPANILLDQDGRPRLADFGQSRLTRDQRPALGTLFYMAPEQADAEALPDTRWDVYALGAIGHAMLVGVPPHRSEATVRELDATRDLRDRLARYQRLLRTAPIAQEHHRVLGVDRDLRQILDRCLAVDPDARYSQVEGILEDLRRREIRRGQRPLLTLAVLGPVLLLLLMSWFGWRVYQLAVQESRDLAIGATRASNTFAAKVVAKNVASALEQRFRAVQEVAGDPEFIARVQATLANPDNQIDLAILRDPHGDSGPVASAISRFRGDPVRAELQAFIDNVVRDPRRPHDASWLVLGPDGTMLAAGFRDSPAHPIVGENFAYRNYFHGGPKHLDEDARPKTTVADTQLSAVFRSTATNQWKVAISTPILERGQVLGVLAMTVELGNIVDFPSSRDQRDQCAWLVDGREGADQGIVLQHPLLDQLVHRAADETEGAGGIPSRMLDYRVETAKYLQNSGGLFRDPFADDPLGTAFNGEWIADAAEVEIPRVDLQGKVQSLRTGLLIVVQSRLTATLAPAYQLADRLTRNGLAAFAGFVIISTTLGCIVVWRAMRPSIDASAVPTPTATQPEPASSSLHDRETLVHRGK